MNENIHSNATVPGADFSVMHSIRKYSRYKLFFIVSIVAALLLAAAYLYWKIPLYRIQSSLVIKDEKKGEAVSLTVKELDFLDEQKIVDNEAEIIRSETNIKKVVHAMKLNIGYYEKENVVRQRPLYADCPVDVVVVTKGNELYTTPIDLAIEKNDGFTMNGSFYKFDDTISIHADSRIILIRKQSIGKPIKLKISIADPDQTTQELRAALTASAASKNSSVLYVSMLYPSRERGAEILKHIISEYDKANVLEKKMQTDSIVTLIEARLALIGEQVRDLENKEKNVKSNQGITFLSDDARSYLDRAKDYDKEYTEAQIQLDNIRKVDEYLTNNTTTISPPNSSLNDPVLTNMVTSLNQLELQKQALLKKSGPQHPTVLAVSKQIDDIKRSLGDNIRLQRSSLEKRIDMLQKGQSRVSADISRVPINERNLLELMREKSIRENIYSYLLQKREEAALSDAAVFSKMRIIDEPFSSIKPVKPKKVVVFGAALLLGLLFPIAFITIRNNSHAKIQAISLNTVLPYPVLGYIPALKKFNYTIFTTPNSIVTEQFRWIRTTLEKQHPKVIMITSLRQNDGKSFVSLNLAASFASTGKKTLLVDFDLRKTKLSSIFALPKGNEFFQQLSSGNFIPENLSHAVGERSNLFIIANDEAIENSTALLDNADLNGFFNSVRKSFDYIIINTPPFTYFTDAYKLESFSDINIFVIRDRTPARQQISKLSTVIDENNIKPPLIVYNDVPMKELFAKSQLKGYKSYQYSYYS